MPASSSMAKFARVPLYCTSRKALIPLHGGHLKIRCLPSAEPFWNILSTWVVCGIAWPCSPRRLMQIRFRGKCIQRWAERQSADFCDVMKGSSSQALSGEATSRGWLASVLPARVSLAFRIKPDFMSNVSLWDIRSHGTSSTGIQTSEEIRDRGLRDVSLCRQLSEVSLLRYTEPRKP